MLRRMETTRLETEKRRCMVFRCHPVLGGWQDNCRSLPTPQGKTRILPFSGCAPLGKLCKESFNEKLSTGCIHGRIAVRWRARTKHHTFSGGTGRGTTARGSVRAADLAGSHASTYTGS